MATGRLLRASRCLCVFLFIYLSLPSGRPEVNLINLRPCEIKQLFYLGSSISQPEFSSLMTTNHTKRSAITPVNNWIKANTTLRLTRDFLLINILIICAGDIATNPGPVGLKLCQWNIQRLTDSKMEELRVFLTKTHGDIDVLILTETFCTSKTPDSFYLIPDFQLHRKDRKGKAGGGILAWVKSSLQVKRRNDLKSNDVETLWLELCPYKSKRPLFIAGVYRPPSYKVDDDKRLGKNIERVYLLDMEMILLGDFNVDYLATNKFNQQPFVKILRSLNLEQLITEVTRPLSNSCLDHIWCTHRERLNNAVVFTLCGPLLCT